MCAIFGALVRTNTTFNQRLSLNFDFSLLWERSKQRGRDGMGYVLYTSTDDWPRACVSVDPEGSPIQPPSMEIDRKYDHFTFIGNMRAEPTTEFVKAKQYTDQQPYHCGDWAIVHNGTIANDKELRTGKVLTAIDSATIVEQLALQGRGARAFETVVANLKGSFAILAVNRLEPNRVYAAANYRPLWYSQTEHGFFFASSRDYLPDGCVPQMMQPYSVQVFSINRHVDFMDTVQHIGSLYPNKIPNKRERSLVVCSGGMDSVVAACALMKKGHEVELIHFVYGSRAQGREADAIKLIAHELGVPLHFHVLPIYSKTDSPLLDSDSKVAGGEEGAEFAHEWVPARNLILLSVATAYAEAHGFDHIALGNNMEEAGAYPDNEPEFIRRFNDLLPFAVGAGKKVDVLMPVGDLMKHEIVHLGKQLNAPLHLTWSCYRAGELHCGTCGPCYMRRTAFAINDIPEVISYQDQQ